MKERESKRAVVNFQTSTAKQEEKEVAGCTIKIAEDKPSLNQEETQVLRVKISFPKTVNLTIPTTSHLTPLTLTCFSVYFSVRTNHVVANSCQG